VIDAADLAAAQADVWLWLARIDPQAVKRLSHDMYCWTLPRHEQAPFQPIAVVCGIARAYVEANPP
jgi:hypothetical protein